MKYQKNRQKKPLQHLISSFVPSTIGGSSVDLAEKASRFRQNAQRVSALVNRPMNIQTSMRSNGTFKI